MIEYCIRVRDCNLDNMHILSHHRLRIWETFDSLRTMIVLIKTINLIDSIVGIQTHALLRRYWSLGG